ncbi:MAG: T9SS type A sorting domain-containing protein [Bacteroidales bacterium]|nr:T9SS type A sorting domain-containing protein [Bacteroidales bacterium]MCF8454927.1 T9SS type A sorting domain-containing protein [Bacteroidales bacterium]
MKNLVLIILSLCLFPVCYAQEFTSNNWFFGYNAGVDFNFGITTVVSGGQTYNGEGCASVGDSDGNLLFYSDGMTVWNKNHQIMQNGTGLLGHNSSTQSCIIAPYPDSTHLFFILTVDALEHQLQNGLRYSIVNMDLDNGLGAVTAIKNVLLENPVCEKILAIVHENSDQLWVLAHRWNSNEFLAYHISPAGINTVPVVSSIGIVHQGGGTTGLSNSIGYLKSNLYGSRIALAIHFVGVIELFDFDNSTGELSNCITSPANYPNVYGVEFSPNNNLLYASTLYANSTLFQFNLTLANPLDSPIYVLPSPSSLQISGLQIAPDGKIYSAERFSNYLSAIHKPGLPGSACDYDHEAIYLNGNGCQRGLPPNENLRAFEFVTGSLSDTTICDGDSVLFGNSYQSLAGMYHDSLVSTLGWDSIVNLELTVLSSPPVPIIYNNQGVLSTDVGYSYQWYYFGAPISGATFNVFNAQALGAGEYQVEVTNQNDCSNISDVYTYVLSADEINMNGFKVYPNPASGEITIEGSGNPDIEIKDIYGNTMFSKRNISIPYQLDISHFKSGVYWIHIKDNLISFASKIVIIDK